MGGYFFQGFEMKFSKAPTSVEQQIDILEQRGMLFADRDAARHYLSHIHYYRLTGYWLPFEADHGSHRFHSGTYFEQVVDSYVYDRELRLLVMDAIERVEVSIRGQWSHHLAHTYGTHAHLQPTLFKKPSKTWHHARAIQALKDEASRSRETFICHFAKYDEALPPLWAIVEIMTIGQLSRWYANLSASRDRNQIARVYGMDEKNLVSFLHHLSVVRNLCAHHGRLWNREFTFTFILPRHRPHPVVGCLNPTAERRLYNTLVMLACLMDQICLHHHFKSRLHELLTRHPTDEAAMGFPTGWRQLPIWAP